MQQFHEPYRNEKLDTAVRQAREFARRTIVPMTEPNAGTGSRERATPGTPARYEMRREVKRGFALARLLIAGGAIAEGAPILRAALRHFPFGNAGQDGAHAADPAALLAALPVTAIGSP